MWFVIFKDRHRTCARDHLLQLVQASHNIMDMMPPSHLHIPPLGGVLLRLRTAPVWRILRGRRSYKYSCEDTGWQRGCWLQASHFNILDNSDNWWSSYFRSVCAKYDTCCPPVVLCCKRTRAIESWPRMEFPIIIHIRTRNYEMRNGKLILQFTFEMFTLRAGLCAETRAVQISIISNKENTNIITN